MLLIPQKETERGRQTQAGRQTLLDFKFLFLHLNGQFDHFFDLTHLLVESTYGLGLELGSGSGWLGSGSEYGSASGLGLGLLRGQG